MVRLSCQNERGGEGYGQGPEEVAQGAGEGRVRGEGDQEGSPRCLPRRPVGHLVQACTTAVLLVEAATGAAAIAAEVMTEEEFNAREGFDEIPELLGAAEAAELLGVSRQRVDQLAAAGKIQAVPIGRNRG